jgi:hypothetical protein
VLALEALSAVAVVAALAVVGARLGGVLLARLGLAPSAERALAGTAIGLGLTSHAIFALGLLGLYGRWLPNALIAIALPLAAPLLRLRPSRRWLLFAAALPALALTLLPATAWDAVSFHLALVKSYARTGHVAPVLNLRYPVFPQLADMLFVPGMILSGPIAGALVESLFVALTAASLWAFGRRWFSERTGLCAALLWLANPMILFLGTNAYIDASLACYTTLAVLAAGHALLDRDDRWLLVAGALAGFAISCKYLGLPFAAGIGLVALIRRGWRGALAVALPALILGAPWYVYDFVHTGDPLFPFGGRWFGFRGPWGEEDLAQQILAMDGAGAGRSLSALLLLPLRLTFNQWPFAPEAWFAPIFLPLFPVVAIGAWRDAKVRALGLVVLAYGLFWFSTVQLLRYLAPASALLSLAAAGAIAPLLDRLQRRLARLALALALVAPVFHAVQRLRDGFPVGAEARRAYLSRALPGFDAVHHLNLTHGSDWHAYQMYLEHLFFYADGLLEGDWFGHWCYRPVFELLIRPDRLYQLLHDQFGAGYLIVPPAVIPWSDPRIEKIAVTPTATVYRLR